jgi:GntR family transcriptional repressor for pyruvate dehydrogenase complex
MSLAVVRNLSLADQVFQQLASAILSSRYKPGQALPAERKLVETFKVNRHVVREALKRLEQIGLVRITQGGGTHVLDFTKHAGLDLLAMMADYSNAQQSAMGVWLAVHEMRAVIMADSVRLCALRGTAELKRELLEIAHKMLALGDGPDVYTLEISFWDRVLEGANNIAYRLAFNSLVKGTHAPSVSDIARVWAIFEVKQGGYRVELAKHILAGDGEAAEANARASVRLVTEALTRLAEAASAAPVPFEATEPATVELQAATVRRKTKRTTPTTT